MNSGWTFKKVVAALLFGAIIVVFALFGVNNRNMSDLGGAAAIVEGTPISIAQFRERMNQLEMQYKWMADMGGEEGRKRFAQQIRFETMRSLIEEEVLTQAARRQGVMITDAELSDQIFRLPFLQDNGVFKRERYDQFLKYRNMRAEDFETEIRKSSARAKLIGLVQSSFWPTKLESEQFLKDREYQYKVRILDVTKAEDKGLSEAVAKKNMSYVENVAKSKNLKWEESGPFDLATGVPRLGKSDSLVSYLDTHESATGLVPFLIEDGVRQYVVDVKSREKNKTYEKRDLAAVSQQLSAEKLQSNLTLWVEQQMKDTKIQQNNRLLQ